MPRPKQERCHMIYVADDDEDMRDVVAATLAAEGYDVRQAVDGQELLTALLEQARDGTGPSLVVSDVAMPRMSGPAACTAARAAGVTTPFIFMTAFLSSGGKSAAEAAGAVAVFDKPFDMAELVTAIHDELRDAVGSANR